MSVNMLIECKDCYSVGCFSEKDSNYFCDNCGTESQDHGQQIVVEDE